MSTGDDLNGFCNSLLNFYPVRTSIPGIGPTNGTGIVMIVLGFLYLFNSALIVYFIKIQQRNAWLKSIVQDDMALLDGDHEKPQSGYFYSNSASYSVIFPLFVKVLWFNTFVDLYVFFIALNFTFEINDEDRITDALAFSLMWALQHLVAEGVAVLLMQKGVGFNAAAKTVRITIIWGIFTFSAYMLVYTQALGVAFAVLIIWELILFSFYTCLWVVPPRRLYRRPAAIQYAQFWCLFRVVNFISTILQFIPVTTGFSSCFYVICCLFPFAILQPWIMYYTLLQDSKWWQGFSINQGRRTQSAEEIRSPLQGVDLNLRTAQSLARSMDSISSGSRKRSQSTDIGGTTFRNGGVRLLNFAYISMDSSKLIGSGSFSKVYIGAYRKRKCAIKLIFTPDLTEDVIQRIGAEAQILSSINHPNVVDIIGVAVLPPSVCILLELCEFGSLADVLKGSGFPVIGNAFRLRFPSQLNKKKSSKSRHPNAFKDGSTGRLAAMQLSWVDRLYLAVGCCRGLAALHAYSADLCHRDIKSFNFLVDHQMNAKIADLELGTPAGHNEDADETDSVSVFDAERINKGVDLTLSRCLKRVFYGSNKQTQQHSQEEEDEEIVEIHIQNDLVEETEKKKKKKKGKKLQAEDFLANWSAPEVIQGKMHSQASDIYSFSLVLWEILTSIVPFSHIKKQDDIRLQVLGDSRPELPRLQLVPAFSSIRKSSFHRRSGASFSAEDRVSQSTGGGGSLGQFDKDLDDLDAPNESAEVQWADEEDNGNDESFIDRMAKKSFAHFIALIQRSWQRERNLRPSASEVLNELEALWHGCCHNLVFDTDADMTVTNIEPSSENRILPSSPVDGVGQSNSRFSGTILTSVTNILTFQSSPSHPNSDANFSFVLAHPYHPLSRRFVRSTNESMRNHPDERFRHLQDSGEAWVVLSLEAPHVLLHATTQWCSMFDLTAAMVLEGWLGRPFKDIAPSSGDDVEKGQSASVLDSFLQFCNSTMSEAKGRAAMHCTLRMMKSGRPNIYSLHAFPIYRRSLPNQSGATSKSIKIPAGDISERRNLMRDIIQEGHPTASSLPEENTVSGPQEHTSGLSRSCPAPQNFMPHSSAVNGEEDNLTDSTGGSAGSGIGLLLASAAGKDGSLSGSGSGSASQDSPKELESSAKAASTSRSGGILKKPASSSSWLFRSSSVDDDSKLSSSSRTSMTGAGRFSNSLSRSSVAGSSRRRKPVLLAILFSKLKTLSTPQGSGPASKGIVQDEQPVAEDSASSIATSSKQSVQNVAEALQGEQVSSASHIASTVGHSHFAEQQDLERGSDPFAKKSNAPDTSETGGISPRRNLNQSECNNQVMPDTMNEYEVGFEMDKI